MDVPQDPSTLMSGDCNPLIPVLPNLGGSPNRDDPCEKIKLQRQDEDFKKRIDTLQANTSLKKETGYIQKWGGDYEYKDNASASLTSNTLNLPDVATNTYIRGFLHVHVDNYSIDLGNGETEERIGIKALAPADVSYFMKLIKNAQTQNKPLGDVYAGMVTSARNYQIRYTGNQYQIKTFTNTEITNHSVAFAKFMKSSVGNPKKLELNFLQYITEKMNLKGITLYRMNADGTSTEIKLNADKTDTIETTCPN